MIELTEAVKTYPGPWFRRDGRVRALDGVTLRVEPGEAVGVVGLNGAGKSTLLKVLLGYVRIDGGTATIGGLPPRRFAERHGVAYVPERVAIPRHWTVRSAIRAYAMLGNLGDDAWEMVDETIDRLGLTPLAHRRIGALSKGNLQRVAIAQCLLGDRQLMVLDEPTDGLDPVWIAELRTLVREWREAFPGRTLVIASHNLPEVERIADRAILLHNGRIQGDLVVDARNGALEKSFLSRVSELEEARA